MIISIIRDNNYYEKSDAHDSASEATASLQHQIQLMPKVSGRSDPEELSLTRDAADTQPSFLQVGCLNLYCIAREKIPAPHYC